jgi:hypothetical protein
MVVGDVHYLGRDAADGEATVPRSRKGTGDSEACESSKIWYYMAWRIGLKT